MCIMWCVLLYHVTYIMYYFVKLYHNPALPQIQRRINERVKYVDYSVTI